jgi:hypothetical protein
MKTDLCFLPATTLAADPRARKVLFVPDTFRPQPILPPEKGTRSCCLTQGAAEA